MGDTGRMAAIKANEEHIRRLEEELAKLKEGKSTGSRLVGVGERVLVKLLVGMGMILLMRYGMITNEELQAANVALQEEKQKEQEAQVVIDYAEEALESCGVPE